MEGLAFVHGIDNVVMGTGITSDYFNYTAMTAGELKLHLYAAQLRTMQQANPNNPKNTLLNQGENILLNAIYKGLHGTKGGCLPTGSIDEFLNPIMSAVKEAQGRFLPASKKGMLLIKRTDVSTGVNPLDQLEPFGGGINGYPYKDGCYWKYCNSNDNPCTSYTTTGVDEMCSRTEAMKDIMNRYLEKSAHHVLYGFATDLQAAGIRPTQNWKVGQHILSMQEMSRITGVDYDNIKTWVETGVLRENAIKGLGVLTPEQTVQFILENPDVTLENVDEIARRLGINTPPMIVVYIILACVTAIVAITGLVQACKGQEPTAFDRLAKIGTAFFSPTGSDFPLATGGGGGSNTCPTGFRWDTVTNQCVPLATGSGSSSNNSMLYIAAAIAAGLALSK